MTALVDAQARIRSVRKLKMVVDAMRGIAAAHAQQARSALGGFRAYGEVINAGLQRASTTLTLDARPPAAAGRNAVVVFAAEHGFAGAFSERVLASLGAHEVSEVFLLGGRGLVLAQQRRLPLAWTSAMASRIAGVDATARRVADALYGSFVKDQISRAEILYTVTTGATGFAAVRKPLLPLDLGHGPTAGSGPPPLTNLPPGRLIEQLVGEYMFAELALAALESFASENAARLATMESARLNIEDKLDELTRQERLLRQEQITAEVQEVTSGALSADDRVRQ
ncbi:F-type H+-transporting ATPase subunit gamma [Phenylobacterium haematophilum]|jgi:F-type H+-transporting ATPase subunit gamma|uniref:F-type H+-transporting ATPase subunit gamma n=1 Tax=Phenylobacterium haematophilum TaxID=98513 RepID=A0A840A5Y4_9CAUL|nr:F0F1 ATP synthase subunit gamma [Phenylobacterium haematophilum]MBB3892970.1 F-type H+-transporting ATPase subunit gamma [Phenylobacterium haematophilum]